MSFIYAELDENNICKAVSDLSGEVIADNMIPLETYDTTLLGKRYEDGEWVEVPQPQPEPEPEEPTAEVVTWDDMAAAITQGVNDV